MPKIICRFPYENAWWYFLWSTIVDAPATTPLPKSMFAKMILQDWGVDMAIQLERALQRADKYGTSYKEPTTFQELFQGNRAGLHEATLSMEEFIEGWLKPYVTHYKAKKDETNG